MGISWMRFLSTNEAPMYNRRSSPQKLVAFTLELLLLTGCVPMFSKTPVAEETSSSPNLQITQQSTLGLSLLAQWTVGDLQDVAWSSDSKMFAVNYSLDGNDPSNNYVQAFSVESRKSMWTANNSLAFDLVFTPDGRFMVESNTNVPLFYWRDVKQGKVVHMGELTDMGQMKKIECFGGGLRMIENVKGEFAVLADYNDLIGLNGPNTVFIRQLDLETGKCRELFDYQAAFFDLFFDLNSSGTLLAYGGLDKENSVVIWEMEKQAEVCRIPRVEFGRFVPGGNTLAVVRNRKIVFIDASNCKEMRELNVLLSPDYETYLAFSADERELAVARDSIQIMSMSTGEILAQIAFPPNAGLISRKLFWSGIKFSPDGRYLLVAYAISKGNEIQLWQLER